VDERTAELKKAKRHVRNLRDKDFALFHALTRYQAAAMPNRAVNGVTATEMLAIFRAEQERRQKPLLLRIWGILHR
jgi:hypothetical protein